MSKRNLDDAQPQLQSLVIENGQPEVQSLIIENGQPEVQSLVIENGQPEVQSLIIENGQPEVQSLVIENGQPEVQSLITENGQPEVQDLITENGQPEVQSLIAENGQPKTQHNRVTFNPVDKGWSWVILACLFAVQMICVGFLRVFGILYLAIQEQYNASATMVTLIGGIQAAVFGLSALVSMTVLLDYLSVRGAVMLGGLIASAGLALSFFASSVTTFLVTQSVLFGIGLPFVFGPGFVLLGSYFDRRRALAAAVANTGGSIGSLFLPPLTRLLLEEFSLAGTFLLLGGLFAQVIVFASFLTPPTDYLPKEDNIINDASEYVPLMARNAKQRGKFQSELQNFSKEMDSMYTEQEKSSKPQFCHSVLDFDCPQTNLKSRDFLCRQGDHQDCARRSFTCPHRQKHATGNSPPTQSECHSTHIVSYDKPVEILLKETSQDVDKQTFKTNGVHSGWCGKVGRGVCVVFDVTLFKSPMFWLLISSSCTAILGLYIPSAFLPLLVIEKGMTMTDSSILLTISGGLDILSRLVPGLIVQMKWMKPQTVVCIAFFVMGLTFQFTAFMNDFATMALFSVVYGLCSGVFISMLQLIIIDFVGIDRFPKAFGLTQLAFGITGAPAFPILGYLRDVSGTYVTSFHFMGASVLLSSSLLLLEPWTRRLERKMTSQ